MTNTIPPKARVDAAYARVDPYARAVDMAQACAAAAHAVIDAAGLLPTPDEYEQINRVTGTAAQAWAAVHTATSRTARD